MRVTTLSRGAGREGSRVQYRKKAGGVVPKRANGKKSAAKSTAAAYHNDD
jgi:hypothetical protein